MARRHTLRARGPVVVAMLAAAALAGLSGAAAAQQACTGQFDPVLDVAVRTCVGSVLPPQTDAAGLNTYGPEQLLDHRPETAWFEGLPGSGIGTRIVVSFSRPVSLQGFQIWTGYGKSPQRFHQNNRVRTLDAALSNGAVFRIDLRDLNRMQTIHLPGGRTEHGVRSIVLTVADVYRGTRWDDTGISELHVRYTVP